MTSRLITLQAWAEAIYGDAAPKAPTLRAWAKSGKIIPAPQKHGRAYFVAPDARYVTANDDAHATEPAKPPKQQEPELENASDMIKRYLQERKAQNAARKRQR